jgi:tetratricopeptide (TPR) repeat protein
MEQATRLSLQGKDQQALDHILSFLKHPPGDPELSNFTATLAARLENWPTAELHFSNALANDPNNSYALYNLAKVFKLSGRQLEAINLLGQLIHLEPENAAALNEIGVLLADHGDLESAIRALETAIALDPSFEKAYRNLYVTLYTGGRYEEAAQVAKNAITRIPSDYRWNFRTDLILCLWKAMAIEEAKATAETLIKELDTPTSPKQKEILLHALTNYGVVLMEIEDPDGAEVQFRRVIALDPGKVEPYVNMAKLNVYREDFQQAIGWFEQAIAIDPEHAELHNHLAIFLRDAGRPDLALPHHISAISQSPGNVEMRFYLGITQFALGQLEEAYPNWELRWARREGGTKSNLPIPEWSGQPTNGKSLLVYREQGIGDEIIFASCLPDATAQFEHVACVCHSKLNKLFSRSFPNIKFYSREYEFSPQEIAEFEWQVPIGTLPTIFRPDVGTFPTNPQLLTPHPEQVEEFRQRLQTLRKTLVIGIGWRSGLLSLNRKALYPYLEFWRELFAISDITWVNLQYGNVTEELKKAREDFGISVVNFSDVDHFNDLDTSAALMKACDIVIGPDTSTTQIAAAVGTPTLRMYSGCDYFCLGTDHYPWFPALNTIPRHFGESWEGPIGRTAQIIRTLINEAAPQISKSE